MDTRDFKHVSLLNDAEQLASGDFLLMSIRVYWSYNEGNGVKCEDPDKPGGKYLSSYLDTVYL